MRNPHELLTADQIRDVGAQFDRQYDEIDARLRLIEKHLQRKSPHAIALAEVRARLLVKRRADAHSHQVLAALVAAIDQYGWRGVLQADIDRAVQG